MVEDHRKILHSTDHDGKMDQPAAFCGNRNPDKQASHEELLPVVSLSDIQDAYPKESDEESMILDRIEETNPTNNLVSFATKLTAPVSLELVKPTQKQLNQTMATNHSSIGQSRTEDTEDSEDEDADNADDVEAGLRPPMESKESQRPAFKNPSTEEELLAFTSDLRREELPESTTRENSDDKVDDDVYGEDEPLTQADAFAVNAFSLFVGADGNREGGRESRSYSIRKSIGNAHTYVRFNCAEMYRMCQIGLLYLIIPGCIVGALLFYGSVHDGTYYPPCTNGNFTIVKNLEHVAGKARDAFNQKLPDEVEVLDNSTSVAPSASPTPFDNEPLSPYYNNYHCNGPTLSWWTLFGVRLVITYGLAVVIQFLLVTYCRFQHKGRFVLIKPVFRLFLLQAKGWPLTLIFWSILNFCVNFGRYPSAKHWLHFVDLSLFDERLNHSDNFTKSKIYRNMLLYILFAGVAVALKRFCIGLHFGRNIYQRYDDRLTNVLKQMLQVSKVANLSKKIRNDVSVYTDNANGKSINRAITRSVGYINELGSQTNQMSGNAFASVKLNQDMTSQSSRGMFSTTGQGKLEVDELLGGWEEPEVATSSSVDNAPSLKTIVQFGCSVESLDSRYPFSRSFRRSLNRKDVLSNSQRLYVELTTASHSPMLHLRTLSLATMNKNGNLEERKMKDLIAVFRPDQDGAIALIEFCKSIDMVYKEMRILRANIANEGLMHAATEKIIDYAFYTVLAVGALMVLGTNPFSIIGIVIGIAVPVSFCIGSSAADFVRGVILILVHRPYDIGDRIAITGASESMTDDGRPQWVVADISLYKTTLVYDATQEFATVSNGAMSTLRILNGARSSGAQIDFILQVDMNRVNNATMEIFKKELFAYVKSKPREWKQLVAFRINSLQPDSSGCVEYSFQLLHQKSWQQIHTIEDSKSDVNLFCFELQMSLGMQGSVPESSSNASHDQVVDDNSGNNSEDGEANALRAAYLYAG